MKTRILRSLLLAWLMALSAAVAWLILQDLRSSHATRPRYTFGKLGPLPTRLDVVTGNAWYFRGSHWIRIPEQPAEPHKNSTARRELHPSRRQYVTNQLPDGYRPWEWDWDRETNRLAPHPAVREPLR